MISPLKGGRTGRSGLLWSVEAFTGSYGEGVVFRVVSLRNNVFESPCVSGGSVIGRVSGADASLSLSDRPPLGTDPTSCGFSARLSGYNARLGFSRVGALSASCSSAVAGAVPVAVLCCPGVGGSRMGCFRKGMAR